MTQVNDVLWKLTPDDTELMDDFPVKEQHYFIDIPHDFPKLELHPGEERWLAYNLYEYFREGYSYPGNIDTEELYYVKVLQVDNEKHVAEVRVLAITTLAAYLHTLPLQQEPENYFTGDILSLGRRLNIAKYRDHYFLGADTFGNSTMMVITTYPEGMYVTMLSEGVYEQKTVLQLGKFEVPASIKAVIHEAETNKSNKFRQFSSKHEDYSPYTEQHGDVIHILMPNPDEED